MDKKLRDTTKLGVEIMNTKRHTSMESTTYKTMELQWVQRQQI